ncbi:signal peptidase I [Scopulibacillus daqui]|uniref:Signal peptidase I n=1 Tax=Scopulibacillus daqui TaxID=1469162 RepID=A0ABS2PWU9_9BACL|nr:signal peptidase I [Scopulibacillus daqui]MBM7644529.1 signal peptidase I [Scopulibacillus daqui]
MNNRKKIPQWLKVLGVTVIAAIMIRTFLFSSYVVEGKSMMPNLQDGNRLIVNKIDYNISKPHRFDVVIFHADKTKDYVKRVIGLPGDKIAYKNDVLYINGKPVNEPYLKPYKDKLITGQLTEDFTLKEYTGHSTVPKGKLWVMGDNRQKSVDSRQFGFVDMDKVVGKVNIRFWPLSKFDLIHSQGKNVKK